MRKENNTTESPHLSRGEWDHPRQYIHNVMYQLLVGPQQVGVLEGSWKCILWWSEMTQEKLMALQTQRKYLLA